MQPDKKFRSRSGKNFYSRTSCEVQHLQFPLNLPKAIFLLTHLMRGATLDMFLNGGLQKISTHAPHARCNTVTDNHGREPPISTHAPHARCNIMILPPRLRKSISTHAPHARCNWRQRKVKAVSPHFYSRTSCEVQPSDGLKWLGRQLFLLTHLMRGATLVMIWCLIWHLFLLTHLMRGATKKQNRGVKHSAISTHAPHARCNRKILYFFTVAQQHKVDIII